MNQLHWSTKQFKVNQLLQLEFNPRKITEEKKKQLSESLDKFNLVEIPAVNTDLKIIGGNQRIEALILAGRGDEEIDVRYPSRTLSLKEVKEYNLISNSHVGEFDLDLLIANFKDVDFSDIGFDIDKIQFENSELFNKSLDKFEKDKDKPLNLEPIDPSDKFNFFRFSNCYKTLFCKDIPFFCLYRNIEMELEKLKSDIRNILPFVYPLAKYLQDNYIKKIAIAPKGDRNEINNFHFVTELMNEVAKIYPVEIFAPFEKIGSRIKMTSVAPEDCFLFDDIITFGTTIKRMNEKLPNKGVIILLTNY